MQQSSWLIIKKISEIYFGIADVIRISDIASNYRFLYTVEMSCRLVVLNLSDKNNIILILHCHSLTLEHLKPIPMDRTEYGLNLSCLFLTSLYQCVVKDPSTLVWLITKSTTLWRKKRCLYKTSVSIFTLNFVIITANAILLTLKIHNDF